MRASPSILQRLQETMNSRRDNVATMTQSSYVASLMGSAPDKVLKKVGEESTEFIIAAMALTHGQESEKSHLNARFISEGADLLFHMMAALTYYRCDINAVLLELERREGIGGITEKNSRKD